MEEVTYIINICFFSSGHQPEWGPETKNLCGPGTLPKHQHCLPGEININTFIYIFFFPLQKSPQSIMSRNFKENIGGINPPGTNLIKALD